MEKEEVLYVIMNDWCYYPYYIYNITHTKTHVVTLSKLTSFSQNYYCLKVEII